MKPGFVVKVGKVSENLVSWEFDGILMRKEADKMKMTVRATVMRGQENRTTMTAPMTKLLTSELVIT